MPRKISEEEARRKREEHYQRIMKFYNSEDKDEVLKILRSSDRALVNVDITVFYRLHHAAYERRVAHNTPHSLNGLRASLEVFEEYRPEINFGHRTAPVKDLRARLEDE